MKTLKLNKIIGLVFLIMMCSFNAYSHPGGTDRKHGHYDNKKGGYHYHCGNYSNGGSAQSKPCLSGTIKPKPWYSGWLVILIMVGGIGGFLWFSNRIDNADKDITKQSLLEKTLFTSMGMVGGLLAIGMWGLGIWGIIKLTINLF
jgi:hypothetical protein